MSSKIIVNFLLGIYGIMLNLQSLSTLISLHINSKFDSREYLTSSADRAYKDALGAQIVIWSLLFILSVVVIFISYKQITNEDYNAMDRFKAIINNKVTKISPSDFIGNNINSGQPKKVCDNCGEVNSSANSYCDSCGRKLF